MDTVALEYFMGIASGQTFWDVSEDRHVSQSSVSKSIARLETDLGVKLFNRDRRTVSLTPAGEIFYQFLLRTEPDFQQTLRQMMDHPVWQKITCCVVPNPEILNIDLRVRKSDFTEKHPDISLSLTRENMPNKAALDLQNDEIDFVIEHRFLDIEDNFTNIPLRPDPLFVLLPREHRLAARHSIDFMELYQETILVRSPSVHKALFDICTYWRKPAPPNLVFFDVPSSELRRNQLIDKIAFGEGITFFFASDLFPFRLDHVRVCPVTGIPDFPLTLLKKKGKIQTPHLKTVEDFLVTLILDIAHDELNIY